MALPSSPAVVLTRQGEDNAELAAALRKRGVPVFEIPCLATRYCKPARLPERVDAVAFSSPRGVRGLVRAGLAEGLLRVDPVPLKGAVGRATADELRKAGFEVDLVADPPEGRVLAGLLIDALAPGARVATVRGNLRAGEMDELLVEAGMVLEPVEVYENIAPEIPRLEPFPVAAVFVASPSAGRRLLGANPWMRDCPFYTIGSTTASAHRDLGVSAVERIGAGFDAWVEALCAARTRAVRRNG